MDPRSILTTYRVEHRHRDGSWGEMVEERTHHDPAEHDPERGWRDGRRFQCTSCDESVMVLPESPDLPATER